MCLAIPGRIIAIAGADPLTRTGRVDFGGALREVNLAFLPDARPDDYVLVHAGVALQRIDEEAAAATLDALSAAEEVAADEAP